MGRANALIDDPVLADLRHGTIRYRKESTAAAEASAAGTPVRSGYFYHARLADNTPGGWGRCGRAAGPVLNDGRVWCGVCAPAAQVAWL